MRVNEVMSKAVETVKPAVHASEAKTRMRQKKIHHLVVTKGSELTGILSERDLGGPRLPKSLVVTTANGKLAGIVTVADLLDVIARRPEHLSDRALRKARRDDGGEDE
jgi:CBS domain-containing protein